jgi:hypothetical protein
MPRVSDKTREQRRQHILTSAWRCFSRDGFHATSIEDVIAATGMSSSAVYRDPLLHEHAQSRCGHCLVVDARPDCHASPGR